MERRNFNPSIEKASPLKWTNQRRCFYEALCSIFIDKRFGYLGLFISIMME